MRPFDPFDAQVLRHPDRVLAVGGGITMTYRQGSALSREIAAGLLARGFRFDDGVAVLGANDPLSLAAMFGAWRAGGIWCPVNSLNSVESNVRYLADAGARWLLYHSRYADQVAEIAARVPTVEHTVCLDDPESLDALRADGQGLELPDWGAARGSGDKRVSWYPTGGTTGRSKLVAIDAQSWAMLHVLSALHWPQSPHPVNLMFAPITHAAGGMALVMIGLGATVVMQDGFDAAAVLRSFEQDGVTHVFAPPTAYYALLNHDDAKRYDYSSLKMLLLASAPVAPHELVRGVQTFGPCIGQSWGQAEAPFIMTWLPPDEVAAAATGNHPERLGSCGSASFLTRVAAMSPDGDVLPAGERGELVARGLLVTGGYLDMPEANEDLHRHGWHHTGDVGYVDEHGYVYIVDRIKDMIISGGFNVYSAEVEAVVQGLDGVLECVVIGTPDERWGEMVTAVVVLADDTDLDADAVIAACKRRLGSVKAPKRVDVVDALAKTPVGKIDKRSVRDAYWQGRDRQV